DVWTRWVHVYGSGLPYLLPGRRVFGERLGSLYRRWTAARREQYLAEAESIAAEGIREGEVVSPPEASCVAPAYSPSGDRIVWSCSDLRTGNAIWLADGTGRNGRVLVQDRGATHFTWRADGRALAYSAHHVVNRFN